MVVPPNAITPAEPTMAELDTSTWAILELMGHRRVAGRVSEVERYGTKMCRLDVPETPGQPATTHFYSHTAIYGEHAVTEATARAAAAEWRPQPIQRWELPAGPELDAKPDDPWHAAQRRHLSGEPDPF